MWADDEGPSDAGGEDKDTHIPAALPVCPSACFAPLLEIDFGCHVVMRFLSF